MASTPERRPSASQPRRSISTWQAAGRALPSRRSTARSWRPQVLVERHRRRAQPTGGEQHRTGYQQGPTRSGAPQGADAETEQGAGDGMQGAEQALRIVHLAGDRMAAPYVAAEHGAIDPVDRVFPPGQAVKVQQQAVAGEQADQWDPPGPARCVDGQHHGDREADADPLRYAGPAHVAAGRQPGRQQVDRHAQRHDPQRVPTPSAAARQARRRAPAGARATARSTRRR